MNVAQIERQFICRFCQAMPEEQAQIRQLNVKGGMFPTHLIVWEYIIFHERKYRTWPRLETVLQQFPGFEVLACPEPLAYYAAALREAVINQTLESAIVGMADQPSGERKAAYLWNTLLQLKLDVMGCHATDWCSTYEERIKELYERRKRGGMLGLCTRWPTFDGLTLGLQNNHLISLVARSGVGKSWVSYLMAYWAWQQNAIPLVCSLEMSREEMGRRFDYLWLVDPACGVFRGLPYQAFRAATLPDAELSAISTRLTHLAVARGVRPLIFLEREEVSGVQSLADRVRQFGANFLVVDAAYQMPDERRAKTKVERLYNICADYKQAAEDLGIPVIVNWQVNRKEGGDAEDKVLWTDALLQQSDLLLDLSIIEGHEELPLRKLSIRKQREGPSGGAAELLVAFDLANGSFAEEKMVHA